MDKDAPPTATPLGIKSSVALELDGTALFSFERVTNRVQLMIGVRPLPAAAQHGRPQVHALIEADSNFDDPDGPLIVVGLGMDRAGLRDYIAHLTTIEAGWTA